MRKRDLVSSYVVVAMGAAALTLGIVWHHPVLAAAGAGGGVSIVYRALARFP